MTYALFFLFLFFLLTHLFIPLYYLFSFILLNLSDFNFFSLFFILCFYHLFLWHYYFIFHLQCILWFIFVSACLYQMAGGPGQESSCRNLFLSFSHFSVVAFITYILRTNTYLVFYNHLLCASEIKLLLLLFSVSKKYKFICIT